MAAIVTLGTASIGSAYPDKTSACSGCHPTSDSVAVTATQTANDGKTATYAVTVSNTNDGQEGWAVFDGSTNVADNAATLGTTGTFSVPVGKSYTVFGVSDSSSSKGGSNSVTLTPTAPATTTTTAPTTTSTAPTTSTTIPATTTTIPATTTTTAPAPATTTTTAAPMPTASVTVTVKNAATGLAVAGTKVNLRGSRAFVGITNSLGVVTFSRVPYGTYKLAESARGFVRSTSTQVVDTASESFSATVTSRK